MNSSILDHITIISPSGRPRSHGISIVEARARYYKKSDNAPNVSSIRDLIHLMAEMNASLIQFPVII